MCVCVCLCVYYGHMTHSPRLGIVSLIHSTLYRRPNANRYQTEVNGLSKSRCSYTNLVIYLFVELVSGISGRIRIYLPNIKVPVRREYTFVEGSLCVCVCVCVSLSLSLSHRSKAGHRMYSPYYSHITHVDWAAFEKAPSH